MRLFVALFLALGPVLVTSAWSGYSSYYVASVVRARELYRQKDFRPALRAAKDAVRLYADGWEGQYLTAKIECDLKRFVECLEHAQTSLKNTPPEEKKAELEKLIELAKNSKPRTAVTLRGTPFYESWEIITIDGDRESLLVKNPTVLEREIPIVAARSRYLVMRQFMFVPGDAIFSPLGYQPEFENIADRACAFSKLKSVSIPDLKSAELNREFQDAKLGSAHPLSARYSSIRYPEQNHLEVSAATFSCKDAPRKRYRLAQQRAALMHIEEWKTILSQKLFANKASAQDSGSDPSVLHVLGSRSQRILAKSYNAQLAQIKAVDAWLESSESRVVLTKDQVSQMVTESTAIKEKIKFQLDRLNRHPADANLHKEDLNFVEYLFKKDRS